jgi:hypothetical protein
VENVRSAYTVLIEKQKGKGRYHFGDQGIDGKK